jgi:hypothetical protein
VHQVSFIVYADGRFESSERLIGAKDSQSVFHKESGRLAAAELETLRGLLADFAESAEPVCNSEAADPFEFESNDRRSIGYFAHGTSKTVCTWMLKLYKTSHDATRCTALFNAIWEILVGLVQHRSFAFDQGFSGPACTKEEDGEAGS